MTSPLSAKYSIDHQYLYHCIKNNNPHSIEGSLDFSFFVDSRVKHENDNRAMTKGGHDAAKTTCLMDLPPRLRETLDIQLFMEPTISLSDAHLG
jgi:hypothetical protein